MRGINKKRIKEFRFKSLKVNYQRVEQFLKLIV